jgi:ABC-type nitrate/sulfonate/bicarbonate transport system permease component
LGNPVSSIENSGVLWLNRAISTAWAACKYTIERIELGIGIGIGLGLGIGLGIELGLWLVGVRVRVRVRDRDRLIGITKRD